jgi:hypothetical protein
MRPILLSLAFLVALMPFGANAQSEMPRNADIETTIQRQLDAFLADDFGTAFTFASPAIKGLFGNAERFGQMVRQGYPMVWRPGSVRYLDLRQTQGRLVQRVMITDQQGRLHLLEYQMMPAAGGWQIDGVQVLRAPAAGA